MYSSANGLMTKEQSHYQAAEKPNRGSVKVSYLWAEDLMTFEERHFGGLKMPFFKVSQDL